MVCNVITADKANRLFWLGRYAERVYISLHLLRRYYDKMIDGDKLALTEYYKHLGLQAENADCKSFQLAQLYDTKNICSIATSLDLANDNSIVLRRDLTSESISYIHLSQVLLNECALAQESNITKLQPITDYMLAFFGSVDERIFDKRIRKFIKVGKLIENLDLHIRFDYEFFRIEEVFDKLKEYLAQLDNIEDVTTMERLEELLSEEQYSNPTANYKSTILGYINTLVVI
ncbi:MAG: alpha-E domain-containing protein [Rikenellaceae bacterium]